MTTKACTQCGVVKPLAAFHKQKAGKFGRRADCKECVTAWQRAHYDANREKLNARNRAYRDANREKENARRRAYRELIGTPTADKWQEISLKHATRNREPWSEEEDRYLANSTARAIDDALALQRTFSSVQARRLRLRRAGLMDTLNSQVIAA